MKICVFGADGRTGIEVVRYAHDRGFEVTAFVYSDESNIHFPSDVDVQKGNVMNYEEVEKALQNVDAVVSVIGHIKGSDPRMQTKGIKHIVRAMEAHGIKRVLSLTGTGARAVGDTPSLIDRFLNMGVAWIDPERIRDGIEHVKVLEHSGLEYTILRVLKLGNSNAEARGVLLTHGGPAELVTSRKKVAKALVDLVQDEAYVGKQPVISG